MKNVLVDMSRLGKNPFNGLYTYCFQLGKSLLKFPLPDIELSYYLPKSRFGLFGNEVRYVSQHKADKIFRLNTSRFDIWHATTAISNYRPFNRKTKFIFTIHDLNFIIEDKDNMQRNKRLLSQIQKKVDRADHLIVISSFALSQAKEFLKIADKPVSIIYPGCSYLTSSVEMAVPQYIPQKPFLFSIGLVEPRKNFHVLVPLLKRLDVELIIAGLDKHAYKNVIIEEAKKHGVRERLRLVGPITEGEKVWYYENCEAFVFPSFAEGFGLPVVEAMYYGKPVFVSKAASLPEVAGDCGYYFDSFDEDVMIKNYEAGIQHYLASKPQEKIKNRAALFSYDKMAKACLEVYRDL